MLASSDQINTANFGLSLFICLTFVPFQISCIYKALILWVHLPEWEIHFACDSHFSFYLPSQRMALSVTAMPVWLVLGKILLHWVRDKRVFFYLGWCKSFFKKFHYSWKDVSPFSWSISECFTYKSEVWMSFSI